MEEESRLQQYRLNFQPSLPKILQQLVSLHSTPSKQISADSVKDHDELSKLFPKTIDQPLLSFHVDESLQHRPLKVGVVLSGGQAAGGHNVISGLYDALKKLNFESRLFGFLNGPAGIVDNKFIELDIDKIAPYRNMGGFDMIGAGRTKIETVEQFQAAEKTIRDLDLDGLVIVGGDDSNTNAALLAEYFIGRNVKTRVIGVPKTIDGDLKNEEIEISFGFDTACKTFSEYIGNVLRDALSARKYYFFIKLMGRSASHIALECALQTHPNLTLIGEEIEAKKQTVKEITSALCNLISTRSVQGKDYGVVLIPEGIIEFIPECRALVGELNHLMSPDQPHSAQMEALSTGEEKVAYISKQLSESSVHCLNSMPLEIQKQLLLDRDPHGNVQVSKIETERLFIETVKAELSNRKKAGAYKGKFSPQPLFCGYEGRSCFPSNFDAQYCYALGHVAALLIDCGATGYLAAVQHLGDPVENWQILGLPLTGLMNIEMRKGKPKPVIRKALVDLSGTPFSVFKEQRDNWLNEDRYRYPGPIQFFGPSELTDDVTMTLKLEHLLKSEI